MYLYYLIGWKIDACRMKRDRYYIQKEKSFILALDGDVDFDPPAFEVCREKNFKQIYDSSRIKLTISFSASS